MPVYVLEREKQQTTGKRSLTEQLIAHYNVPTYATHVQRELTARIAAKAFDLFARRILIKNIDQSDPPQMLLGMPILRGGLSLMEDNNAYSFNKVLQDIGLPSLTMSAISVAVDHIGHGKRYKSASIQWSTFGDVTNSHDSPSTKDEQMRKKAVVTFDWGIATGLTLRTTFNWLKSLGFCEGNIYCLAMIGVPSEIESVFINEHVALVTEAAFRPGTIYVDYIGNKKLAQTKDWGHSHYPTDTQEDIDDFLMCLKRVVNLDRADVEILARIYRQRPSLSI